MITIVRRHQKILMLIVAVLTIIAFAWLYNPADTRELGANVAAVGYGRTFTRTDLERQARLYQLALALGEAELVSGLTATAPNEEAALGEFVFNLIALRQEAAALGVEPTLEQVAARVREVPAFQTRGAFDPQKFESFAATRLGALGMTSLQIEEVTRDALRFERLRAAVGGASVPSRAEIARAQRPFQQADLLVVKFPRDATLATREIPEEEALRFFNQNQRLFTAPETVTVEYAKFSLPAEGVPAEGKERVAALQEVAGRAAAFAESGSPDFASLEGVEVGTAGPFDRTAAGAGTGKLPPVVAQSAFLLDPQRATSDVIQSGDDFFVIRVTARNPERVLEFAEAREEVIRRLRESLATGALQEQAAQAVAKIRAALAGGSPPAEAAAAAGFPVTEFPGVEPARPGALPDDLQICGAVSTLLEPGQISNPLPVEGGAAAVLVASRALPPEDPARTEAVRQDLTEGGREFFFASWLVARREAAGLRASARR